MKPLRPDTARRPFRATQILLAIHALGLLAVAVWFRCRSLGNIPGINGDESWYGVMALRILGEQRFHVQTPTGNPPNLFFLGPLVLLHAWFRPSIVLLRCVAVASGLAALAINWLLCRWIFDRRTATISTVILAVLPINIAYSRFAWDASQSVAATLPVLYFSLAAVRFRARQGRWIVAAVFAQVVAILVHPTNLFAGAAIATALAARRWDAQHTPLTGGRQQEVKRIGAGVGVQRRMVVGVGVSAIVLVVLAALWLGTPAASRFVRRMGDVRELVRPRAAPHFSVLYPRLFTGPTTYRFIAGSRSWFEWPAADQAQTWGIDVVLFWMILAAAVWFLWRSQKLHGRAEDRVLIAAWALQLVTLLLIAGSAAMVPGWERFALCLIAPTVVLASRGAALCFETSSGKWRLALGAASLAGWLVLADFHVHYFRFMQRTGGRSHETFRTAAVEPKTAALRTILEHRGPKQTRIVASDWHLCWPLRYLATSEEGILVDNRSNAAGPAGRLSVPEAGAWRIEFSGSEGHQRARAAMAGRHVRQWQFEDYSGRPVVSVLHVVKTGPIVSVPVSVSTGLTKAGLRSTVTYSRCGQAVEEAPCAGS